MPDALRAKRAEIERTQTNLPPKLSGAGQRIQRSSDPARLPLYAQAWGNLPPPWLRLPTLSQPSIEQPIQRQVEEGSQQSDEETIGSEQELSLTDTSDDAHPVTDMQQEDVNESEEVEGEGEDAEEKDFEDVIGMVGRVSVMLGSATHHVEIRMVEGVPVVGVASTWTQLNSIIDTLLKAANDPKSDIAGRQADIKAIFAPAKAANYRLEKAEKKYRQLKKVVRSMMASKRKQGVKKTYTSKTLYNKREQRNKAYGLVTDATIDLERLAKDAIAEAWEDFGEFLPANLIPAGEVFKKRPFTGKLLKYIYHTGTALDPIPIYWYKPPADYPKITYKGKTYEYDNPVTIGGVHFGVTQENDPNEPTDFQLRKSAHNETRAGQKYYNDIFNYYGVIVGGTPAPALGDAGGYDGDHVKDLGFGGKDNEDNYWPLAASINRRAFNGYNSRYIVNYLDTTDNKYYSRAIGGLIGKYFVVKGYWDDVVPDESGKAKAGTNQV